MNSQNNLARWTLPTTDSEKSNFRKNAGAISRYRVGLVIVQLIMIGFSIKPAVELLNAKLTLFPFLLPYTVHIAVIGLCFLHYVLHGELLETLSNVLDSDDKTNNDIGNWVAPSLIIVGLLALDIIGTQVTLRDDSFDAKREANKTESSAALNGAKTDYIQSLANIATTRHDDSAATVAPFLLEKQRAKRMVENDKYDVRAKQNKLADIENRKTAALGMVRQKAADDTRAAQSEYVKEKNRITGKRETVETALNGADDGDKAKAQSYGWIISIFLYILFFSIAHKLVKKRVESGIRINVQFSELDAQGGFFEKLWIYSVDIAKRQGHRLLYGYHKLMTAGTRTLRDVDGNIILLKSNYNSGDAATGTGGNGGDDAPPQNTIGGNDDNGGGGGGNPTPSPTPPQKLFALPYTYLGKTPNNVYYRNEVVRYFENVLAKNGIRSDFELIDNALQDYDPIIVGFDNADFDFQDEKSARESLGIVTAYHKRAQEKNSTAKQSRVNLNNDIKEILDTPTPSVSEQKTQTATPVITDITTVITDKEVESTFSYGDKILKGLKQEANTDVCNWNSQNGTPNSIRERLRKRVQELDKAIREVKSSSEVRQLVCNYFADYVHPITKTTAMAWKGKEVTNE